MRVPVINLTFTQFSLRISGKEYEKMKMAGGIGLALPVCSCQS